jgi:hypothetical protein
VPRTAPVVDTLLTVGDECPQISRFDTLTGWANDHDEAKRIQGHECLTPARVAFDNVESVRQQRGRSTACDADRDALVYVDVGEIVEAIEARFIHRRTSIVHGFDDVTERREPFSRERQRLERQPCH